MNRFDKPVQYDYSFDRYMPEYYMPNFAAWGQVIERENIQDEAAKGLFEKFPAYIKEGEVTYKDEVSGQQVTKKYGDEESNKFFRQKLKTLEDEMNAAAQTGDMQTYRQKRADALREINRMWQPGGHAQQLQARYDEFVEGMKKLKEQGEKSMDWETMNKDYATIKFLENIGIHDPNRAELQTFGSPDIYPFQDILKDATAYAKDIGYIDHTVEYNDKTGAFIVRDRQKNVIPEAGDLVNKFIKQEKYGKQFGINKFRYIQGVDMEALKQETEKENEKIKQLNTAEATLFKETETEVNKNNVTAVKKLQQDLKNLGYNLDVDGQYGKQTEQALSHFREKYSPNRHKEYTPQELIEENIIANYADIASGVFSKTKSVTRRADPYYMATLSFNNNRKLIEEQYDFAKLSIPVAVGTAENITVDKVNERATQSFESLLDTERTLTDALTPIFGAFYKNDQGDKKGIYNLGPLFENVQKAWINSNGEFGAFTRELNNVGINPNQINVDSLINYIKNGVFDTHMNSYLLAKSQQEESATLAEQTVSNAFDKWLEQGGKSWIDQNAPTYKDNYKLFYDYYFKFKPNASDPYGSAPAWARAVGGGAQWVGRRLGISGPDLGAEALAQMRAKGIYLPGQEVVAPAEELGAKNNGYSEEFLQNTGGSINLSTLQSLPAVIAEIGEGSQVEKATIINNRVEITGTSYPVVKIEYITAEKKKGVATVPVIASDLFRNYDEDATNAYIADIMDKDGNVVVSDKSRFPIGRMAFNNITNGRPVISQNNALNYAQDLKINSTPMQIGSSFKVQNPDPSNPSISQYAVFATRLAGGAGGIRFGLSQYNPSSRIYEPIESFQNYTNAEELQAEFAIEVKRRSPAVVQLVQKKPKAAVMQRGVLQFNSVPTDDYEDPSDE
jgi:hypothetical protein